MQKGKFYNHCNTMEIDMTEIARDEKASKQPPLAAKLLNKFTVTDSNIPNSPIFNWSALKSTGNNNSYLPHHNNQPTTLSEEILSRGTYLCFTAICRITRFC